jgi:YD repeat-containing protein
MKHLLFTALSVLAISSANADSFINSITTNFGHTYTFEYDSQNRLIKETDTRSNGNVVEYNITYHDNMVTSTCEYYEEIQTYSFNEYGVAVWLNDEAMPYYSNLPSDLQSLYDNMYDEYGRLIKAPFYTNIWDDNGNIVRIEAREIYVDADGDGDVYDSGVEEIHELTYTDIPNNTNLDLHALLTYEFENMMEDWNCAAALCLAGLSGARTKNMIKQCDCQYLKDNKNYTDTYSYELDSQSRIYKITENEKSTYTIEYVERDGISDALSNNGVDVKAIGRNIIVSGDVNNCQCQIFNANGVTFVNEPISGTSEFKGFEKGLYIVKVGSTVKKLIVR